MPHARRIATVRRAGRGHRASVRSQRSHRATMETPGIGTHRCYEAHPHPVGSRARRALTHVERLEPTPRRTHIARWRALFTGCHPRRPIPPSARGRDGAAIQTAPPTVPLITRVPRPTPGRASKKLALIASPRLPKDPSQCDERLTPTAGGLGLRSPPSAGGHVFRR